MSEPKTKCENCDVEIQQHTADRNGGLCAPCKNGTRKLIQSRRPAYVSCIVDSEFSIKPEFRLLAQDLLSALETTPHVGDLSHPNRYELEAQRALLRHAIMHHVDWRLNDDHWGKTGFAILSLFEQGHATMNFNGSFYKFKYLVKKNWSDISGPRAGEGGFLYCTQNAEVIFKIMTWVS